MTTRGEKTSSELKRLEETLAREVGRAAGLPRGLERRVRAALVPVEPSQQFVRELGRGLMATAMRSRQSLIRRYRTAIVIGAAVFGSVASVVGVVALIMRQRSRA